MEMKGTVTYCGAVFKSRPPYNGNGFNVAIIRLADILSYDEKNNPMNNDPDLKSRGGKRAQKSFISKNIERTASLFYRTDRIFMHLSVCTRICCLVSFWWIYYFSGFTNHICDTWPEETVETGPEEQVNGSFCDFFLYIHTIRVPRLNQ